MSRVTNTFPQAGNWEFPTDEHTVVEFHSGKAINGATDIYVKTRPNGTIMERAYYLRSERGPEGSRQDGPYRYSEDADGNLYTVQYSFGGKGYSTQAELEADGGSGWIGSYFKGEIQN